MHHRTRIPDEINVIKDNTVNDESQKDTEVEVKIDI